jgi:predicted CoA-substrate-specific enzyme activase
MIITAGIDIGSTTSKAVLLKGDTILGQVIVPSVRLPAELAREVFEQCCEGSGVGKSEIEAIATTGYGRRNANFGDMVITEIKAAGRGASMLTLPAGRIFTIIDVGGQDTKVIALNEDGDVEDFRMNEKCAAGTGRFLEMLAKKLEMDYEEFVEAALRSTKMIHMNSTCAVFAESEVVSLLARGEAKEDIAAAAHNSIAERVGSMIRRVGTKEVICFTGGGALNTALVRAIEESLNKKVFIPEHPQIIVALGAAVVARDKVQKNSKQSV